MTDLSFTVIAHDETLVAGPTMTAADSAVAAARAAGFTLETVVVLNDPPEATVEWFGQPELAHWERWQTHESDAYRARNAVVPRLAGRTVGFLDVGALCSANWLVEGLRQLHEAETAGQRVIAHPEVALVFDGSRALRHGVDQEGELFTPHLLSVTNCYDGPVLAPRAAYLEVPYAADDPGNGLAGGDWQFALQTLGRGWKHVLVRDTVGFERDAGNAPWDAGPAAGAALVRALPELRIDRVGQMSVHLE